MVGMWAAKKHRRVWPVRRREAPAEEMSPPPPPPSEPPDEPPPEPIAEEPPRRFDLAAVLLGVLGRRSGAS